MSERKGRTPSSVAVRTIWVLFGAYIVVTSLAGIFLGVQAFNGWLAVLYGVLGASMGLAAIFSGLIANPNRAILVGWCLVGLATRAVLEGGLYFWVVSLPVAAVLVTALAVSLTRMPSWSRRTAALAAGIASILVLALLAAVAPALPAICPPRQPSGTTVSLISYPPNAFPWDWAEHKYVAACI